MKKILCSAVALCVFGGALTGCGKSDESESHAHNMLGDTDDWQGVDISGDDLPYGSVITEIRPANDPRFEVPICFDSRYFAEYGSDDDLTDIYKIHDYIIAINKGDGALMESLYYPGFLNQVCVERGYDDVQDYVDQLHSSFESKLGEGFEIDYINVSNCYGTEDEEAQGYFTYVEDSINDFDASLWEKITNKKLVEVGGYTNFTNADGNNTLTNFIDPLTIGFCEIDGEYYIF